MTTEIKICGMMRQCDVEYINELKPDYCGFILSPGFRRSINKETANTICKMVSKDVKRVGVFVNEPVENIVYFVKEDLIDIVQLHGKETEEDIAKLREELGKDVSVIKAFKITSHEDLTKALDSSADFLLLDNGTGTGKTFDWSILNTLPESERSRTFLAGGLNKDNVREAMETIRPFALDTSSGVETEGYKDFEKIKEYIDTIRR